MSTNGLRANSCSPHCSQISSSGLIWARERPKAVLLPRPSALQRPKSCPSPSGPTRSSPSAKRPSHRSDVRLKQCRLPVLNHRNRTQTNRESANLYWPTTIERRTGTSQASAAIMRRKWTSLASARPETKSSPKPGPTTPNGPPSVKVSSLRSRSNAPATIIKPLTPSNSEQNRLTVNGQRETTTSR